MKRNTISREFFSTIAGVLVLGLMLLCAIQTALSTAYFYQERRDTLTSILDTSYSIMFNADLSFLKNWNVKCETQVFDDHNRVIH